MPDQTDNRVLVVGIYLLDTENCAEQITDHLRRSRDWQTDVRWAAIGKAPTPPALDNFTVLRSAEKVPKFQLVNRLLRDLNLDSYRYLLVTDDDVGFGNDFLDRYLESVERLGLALAQPARTHESYIDHKFVAQILGIEGRETRFVEIGPLFSVDRGARELLVPFDESAPMGWGLDRVWPKQLMDAGLCMGIVDCAPVTHNLRKPVTFYDYDHTNAEMAAYLSRHPNLPQAEAFKTLASYPAADANAPASIIPDGLTPNAQPTRLPKISAVVCTHNRADLLRKALAALCGQTLPNEAFEVIVIDDGSTDDTRAVAQSFADKLPLRYAYQDNSGLASGKNHGLVLSRAPVVLFLDDDDVASPTYLEEHVRTHALHPDPATAVLGYTGLAYDVRSSPLMHFVTEVKGHLFSYGNLVDGSTLDFSYFWGGRSSCKRAFLLEHGVFNPVFTFGAEDIELGFRLSKFGLRVVYNRNAVTIMLRTLTFEQFCNRCYRQGRSNWVFGQIHPDEPVQSWAQLATSEEEWETLAPIYDDVVTSARNLDRYANELLAVGLEMPEDAKALLYRAYSTAIRASRIKGTMDARGSTTETTPTTHGAQPSIGEKQTPLAVFGPAIESYDGYTAYRDAEAAVLASHRAFERSLIKGEDPFALAGYCSVCAASSEFAGTFDHAYEVEGVLTPNWRETLVCPGCGLNNRMRAVLHALDARLARSLDGPLYITEQATAFFTVLKRRYPQLIGSEHLEEKVGPGEVDTNGLRNEDVTRLSFDTGRFRLVMSFDVLEHVPDYRRALEEFHRVLGPRGRLLLSVPFLSDHADNVVRARIGSDGAIVHLLPPEYHGDPIRQDGCLAFYHFGWRLLEEMREIGFSDVHAVYYWSQEFGYLGADQMFIEATRVD